MMKWTYSVSEQVLGCSILYPVWSVLSNSADGTFAYGTLPTVHNSYRTTPKLHLPRKKNLILDSNMSFSRLWPKVQHSHVSKPTRVEVRRWTFVRNAVNYIFHHIHRIHRISYIILPVLKVDAVNFCKKCGELFFLPHSPHFSQKFTAFTAFEEG